MVRAMVERIVYPSHGGCDVRKLVRPNRPLIEFSHIQIVNSDPN
jgi:hypothetical protein